MVGLATASLFIASAVGRLSLGVLGGGKKTITLPLFAFVIISLCPALYPIAGNIMLLSVLRAVQGFASASVGTASLTLAALTIRSIERDKGVGAYTASVSLGMLAGPAITTFAVPLFGISNTFYFSSLMGLIGFFSAFLLNKKVFSIEKNWQIIGVSGTSEPIRGKISTITRNRIFGMAFVGNFAFFSFFGVLLAYAPLYAKEVLNFGNEDISLLFLIYYIATTVTRFSIGGIVRIVSKPKLVILGTIFSALFSLALTIVVNDLFFTAIFGLIGAVQGILFPVGSMLIAESVQPSRSILANSLYVIGIDIGQAMAPLFTAGVIIQYGLKYSFVFSGAILTVAILLLIWLKGTPKNLLARLIKATLKNFQ